MKTFQEWAKERYLQEGYGFEDDPAVENLDEELYGIRQTLKNALAGNKLSGNWGDLGMRVTNLAKVLPNKEREIQDLRKVYDQLIAPISQAYQQVSSYGREDHPKVRELTEQAIKDAYRFFPKFERLLYALGSGSLAK